MDLPLESWRHPSRFSTLIGSNIPSLAFQSRQGIDRVKIHSLFCEKREVRLEDREYRAFFCWFPIPFSQTLPSPLIQKDEKCMYQLVEKAFVLKL